MEFPHLGQHCSEATCNRLDFLPMKCDSCDKVFCSGHFNYERHNCPGGKRKDVQVPVCPLCGEPVPTPPGVAPDLTVSQHIDKQCKSDTKRIFTNRCSYKQCKKRELIPVTCTQCHQNFCLRHRHTTDHECGKELAANTSSSNHSRKGDVVGQQSSSSVRVNGGIGEAEQRKLAANAAEYRRTNKPTTLFNSKPKPTAAAARTAAATSRASTHQVQNIQGNISEDEALARALALSIMELDESADRNRRNEAAAAAAAQQSNTTVPVGGRDGQQTHSKDKCSLS